MTTQVTSILHSGMRIHYNGKASRILLSGAKRAPKISAIQKI